jgi:hypothetical protein
VHFLKADHSVGLYELFILWLPQNKVAERKGQLEQTLRQTKKGKISAKTT